MQRKSTAQWTDFALLGGILGCAFMTKSFAAVLSPCFLAGALYSARRKGIFAPLVMAFVITFAAISLPYSLMLSSSGRTSTVLSAARLNYLWTILNGPTIVDHYSRGYSHLKHPPALIFKDPKVYYYARPIDGTFPLWFDVGYWADGIDVKIDPFESLVCFAADWCYFFKSFLYVPVLSFLAVVIITASPAICLRAMGRMRLPLFVSVLALLSYSLVVNVIKEQPQTQRYFPGFALLIYMSTLMGLKVKRSSRSMIAVITFSVITLTFCCTALRREVRLAGYSAKLATHETQDIAIALNRAGLLPGEEVAMMANSENDLSYYKMAGLKIVATIAEPCLYWLDTLSQRQHLNELLRKRGIKAIIFRTTASNPTSQEYWQTLAGENTIAFDKETGRLTLHKDKMPQLQFFAPQEGWQRVDDTGCFYLKL